MTDDPEKKNYDTAPPETGEESVEGELRKISDDELQTILAEHKKWLESDGEEGSRADIHRVDLRKANLRGVCMREAWLIVVDLRGMSLNAIDLREAVLFKADLRDSILFKAKLQKCRILDAKMSGSDLSRSNLSGADIVNATGLAEANLQDCNLEGATGLKGTEFARADITGAKLPKDIREFKSLKVVEEISKNARKIFLAMLLGCAYAWLTILTTTDARLILNSATSPLPIIRTEIPIAYFYYAAPFILIGLFVYLHLYLHRLWEGSSKLPAVFEDGKRLDERAYPWLINGLVRRHFEKLKKGRSLMAHLEEYASVFLAWWVLPLTLGAFWYRYLWRHEWLGTSLHIALIVLSVATAILFYRSHARTLRGKERAAFSWLRFYRDRRTYQTLVVAITGLALVFASVGAIEGLLYTDDDGNIPCWAHADLREAQLSIKPPNYWSLDPAIRDSAVIGANLKGADLRYADLSSAFLVNADLRDAALKHANLEGAFIVNANLCRADLRNSAFFAANLTGASLRSANLTGASLQVADLSGAQLSYVDLTGADLRYAILTGDNLRNTNLTDADLSGAELKGADLSGAVLTSVNITGTDLRDVIGLTQAQLDQACGDTLTTLLPPGLTIKQCPEG